MPAYAWSCLSCGRSNAATHEHCSECACPAAARSSQIEEARRQYTQRGGTLENDARTAATVDIDLFDVLVKLPFLLFLGFWPSRRSKD